MIAAYMEQQAYIPFTAAAEITGLPAVLLRKLVRDGVLEGEAPWRTKDVTGSCNIEQALGVTAKLEAARRLVEGNPILGSEAALKYKFSRFSIYNWKKQGWIKQVGKTPSGDILFDEGDIAFARALADLSGHLQGKPVFPPQKRK